MPEPDAPTAPNSGATRDQFRALAVFVIALGALAALTVLRFLAPIVVAAWFAGLTADLRARVAKRIGDRHRVAAVATALLVVIIVAPMVLLAVPIVGIAVEFGRAASRGRPEAAIQQLVRSLQGGQPTPGSGGGGGATNSITHRLMSASGSLTENIPSLMSSTFSTVSVAVMQLFLLAVCAYYFSAEGQRMLTWVERGSPLARPHFQRLSKEFMSVARAMLIGELLTAVAQGTVAGVVYVILGLPSPLLLGVLTVVASLIPTVGSSLVWAPLALLLGLAGRTKEAIIIGSVGVVVIGSIDNILRPFFARMGAAKVHPLLLFLGIFGGLEAFGGWGIILGPLALALFVAAFQIYARECNRDHPDEG